MPRITANISTDEQVEEARLQALTEKKSLRNWAGELIEKELVKRRAKLKKGPKLLPR